MVVKQVFMTKAYDFIELIAESKIKTKGFISDVLIWYCITLKAVLILTLYDFSRVSEIN